MARFLSFQAAAFRRAMTFRVQPTQRTLPVFLSSSHQTRAKTGAHTADSLKEEHSCFCSFHLRKRYKNKTFCIPLLRRIKLTQFGRREASLFDECRKNGSDQLFFAHLLVFDDDANFVLDDGPFRNLTKKKAVLRNGSTIMQYWPRRACPAAGTRSQRDAMARPNVGTACD